MAMFVYFSKFKKKWTDPSFNEGVRPKHIKSSQSPAAHNYLSNVLFLSHSKKIWTIIYTFKSKESEFQ